MKPDVREMYLKKILEHEPQDHIGFKKTLSLIRLFLEGSDESANAEKIITEFLNEFETEGETISIENILYNMDVMKQGGKKYLVIKGEYERKRFTYPQLLFMLSKLEEDIMKIVRIKSRKIRITNPEIAAF